MVRGRGWYAALIAVVLVVASALLLRAQTGGQVVREQRSVVVGGVTEQWQLVWDRAPRPVCGPEDPDKALSCPCSGWAYGEYGHLALVRHRGQTTERLDLPPFFREFDTPGADPDAAYLQRRPLLKTDVTRLLDSDRSLAGEIERRPASVIMDVADYDHDGAATEFLLQIGTLPCGHAQFAALGVTAKNAHLHALGAATHPGQPLYMPREAWQALARRGDPTTIPTLTCGDHGSEEREELVVSASRGDIHVRSRRFSCPGDGSRERLIEESDQ
jgi:hypothetical protein